MIDLIADIDKIHTTESGKERIRRNLELQAEDVVSWCRDAVIQADIIISHGKNFYVYYNGAAITINAHSYTIITAHKIKPKIRSMQESEYECLHEFLYQAIFIPEGEELPPRSIIDDPEISIYIKEFGNQLGDLGVVAEQNGQIVGAAWTRIISAYGNIDNETPELAISVLPEFRGYGIGARLVENLFGLLRKSGYKRTTLSVQKDNPAIHLYQRLGYIIADERLDHVGHVDYIMVKSL